MADKRAAARRIENLRQEIARHNRLYYVEARNEIGDREFDALMEDLQRLEAEHPDLITPDSPTQKVGGEPISEFQTAEHIVPMMSMDNTYSQDDVREFDARVMKLLGADASVAYVVEPKIDGVAVNLIYEDGMLSRAITRGDGRVGDVVTHNARTIRDLPLKLMSGARPATRDLSGSAIEIRGEVYMPFRVFEHVSKEREKEGEALFANPRNATAGSLKLLDPRIAAKRGLRLFTYEVGHFAGIEVPDSHWETLELLRAMGCPTNPKVHRCEGLEVMLKFCADWEKRAEKLDYPVDGLVIKVDSRRQREALGATSKSPRFMIAYKFAHNQQVTILEDIKVQVGKTGQLTPVAVLKPVQLSGTTVSRASLHNFDEVERKDIRLGDHVVIEKAGEIIPDVKEVVEALRTGRERKFPWPVACPVCGSAVRAEFSVSKVCLNDGCPAKDMTRARARLPINRDRCEGCGGRVLQDARKKAHKVCHNPSCAACGKLVERELLPREEDRCDECKGPVKVTVLHFCVDPMCPARTPERIGHFGGRGAMDIEGMGDAIVEQLVEAGLVSDYADLYSLKAEDVAELEHMADKSAQNLIDGIAASKDRGLARLLFAMGIPHVGVHIGEVLAEHFKDIDELMKADVEKLQQVPEVGETVARAIVEFFSRDMTKNVVRKLKHAGVSAESKRVVVAESSGIAGKTFVVTGTLKNCSRSEIEGLIKSLGGRIVSSVSSKTDYLVAGEDPGSKLDKARSLGVKILSEEEFEKLRKAK